MSVAEQEQIQADGDLKKEEINGETLLTKTRDEAIGMAEAQLIEISAKNTCNIKIAGKMLEIA